GLLAPSAKATSFASGLRYRVPDESPPEHRRALAKPMTILTTQPATQARLATGFDWPFLIAAALATTLLVMLVLIDGQPAAAALILGGFALGAVFLKTEFSFTAAWRRLIVRRQADGFLAGLLLIAIAAGAIVPVA